MNEKVKEDEKVNENGIMNENDKTEQRRAMQRMPGDR